MNGEQKNLVNGIKEDSDRLLKITGELLNITQVESGIIQLNSKLSNIQVIIDYAVNANKSSAEQKQIHIKVKIEENLTQVFADAEKTAWVLNNLLSNAIRYSYENSEIEMDVRKENDKVLFSVKDFGRGIEEQYLDKVFDRYFRIPWTKKEGTG